MVYLLSESHSSVHTFVDEGKILLDVFACDVNLEDRFFWKIMCDIFGASFFNSFGVGPTPSDDNDV